MRILDVLSSPWAILPEKLAEITEIYATHLRGEKIEVKAIEAQLGRPLANDQATYDVRDGVAIIDMQGVLAKRMNLFTEISGGSSTELIGRDLRAALASDRVHAIVLNVDSPGGTVDGIEVLAGTVLEASRGEKPIVTYADGTMASAAYWIGSAALESYISGDTAVTGSIGVRMQHVDRSKQDEARGIKVTEIFAGKYKSVGTEHAPLTGEDKAYLQDLVDQTYSAFVNAVARHREVEVGAVLQNMADGRLFVGRKAIDAGLVDGVSTLDALVADLQTRERASFRRRRGSAGR